MRVTSRDVARTVADSLSFQKQLNQLFQQKLDLERQVLDTMNSQLRVAQQLRDVTEGVSSDELANKLDSGKQAAKALGDELTTSGDIGAKALASLGETATTSNKSVVKLGSVFTGILGTAKSLVMAVGGVGRSIFNIGKALLAIPLSIFKNLLADAAAMGGDTSFLQALEAIRKEFGSFQESVSANILGAYTTMNTQLQQVSGLSVWQVFETPAEQLKYLHEIATKAGSQILQFGEELKNSAGIIATFDKGMGIGAENMRSFMNRATVFGTTVTKQLNDTANYALQMGKDFGISSKVLSREVGNMMKDVRNFGSLTQKQMTVAAVYTKKLGLEMKDLTGLVDKFDNFDKAAESAAMLSQAFGASVDAFKLMNEQDPAKRLDELRKSLQATGRSTENMTRQELHLLAQTAGLSDEAAKLAFSTKNQGLTYDQVQKGANKAELAQIKQADALAKLADNIERVVRSGGQMEGSFWRMFVAGFERGVKWSNEYRTAMMNVRAALWQTFMAGDKVGRAFAASENVGFGKFMRSFGDTFSPKNVNRLMNGFVTETKDGKVKVQGVVGELTDVINGKQGFGQALQNIRTHFKNIAGSENLKIMLESGKKMIMFVAKGIGSGAAFLVREVTRSLRFLANPKEALDAAGVVADGTLSFGSQLIKTFKESFGDPKLVGDLFSAFKDLILKAVDKIKDVYNDPKLQEKIKPVMKGIMLSMFGPAAAKTALGSLPQLFSVLANPVGAALVGAVGTAVAGVSLHSSIEKFGDVLERDTKLVGSRLEKQVGAGLAGTIQILSFGQLSDVAVVDLAKNITKYAHTFSEKLDSIFGPNLAAAIRTNLQEQFGYIVDIGGLLKSILEGDGAGIAKGLYNVFTRGAKIGISGMRMVFLDLPAHIITWLSSQMDQLANYLFMTLSQPDGPSSIWNKMKSSLVDVGSSFLPQLWSSFKNLFVALGEKLPMAIAKLGTALLLHLGKYVFSGQAANDMAMGMLNLGVKLYNYFIDGLSLVIKEIPGFGPKIVQALKSLKADVDEQTPLEQKVEKKAFELGTERLHGSSPVGSEASTLQADVAALTDQKSTLEAGIKELTKFAEGGTVQKLNDVLPQQTKLLEEFNQKLSVSTLESSLRVTEDIVKSVNDLNSILGDGSGGVMKIGTKLQRLADNSGLGRTGKYEIKNKGISLKLDLKIVMDAGEVERAIVLRKESFLFDVISDLGGVTLNDKHQAELDAIKGGG